ncbi:MAG: ATP synthase F0 subunit B [bacterium]|nr:ATP synthase F0 subunit B [bacterium]
MDSLLHNLGLDWKLLLSQAINFFILLLILRFLVYKPLLEILAQRRKKIERGLEEADEAERRLGEITLIQKEKIKEAEGQALGIMRSAEEQAKKEEKRMLAEAAEKEKQILKFAEAKAQGEREAALKQVRAEAVDIVKSILITTVSVAPEAVDEALIKKIANNRE